MKGEGGRVLESVNTSTLIGNFGFQLFKYKISWCHFLFKEFENLK